MWEDMTDWRSHIPADFHSRYAVPCEDLFDELARERPDVLIALIESGTLDDADLTFAAEALGKSTVIDETAACLLRLLKHPVAVVREGALYGLGECRRPDVDAELRRLAILDSSKAIRRIAAEMLEDE